MARKKKEKKKVKHIRLTEKNIREQKISATPGTLIHWVGSRTCSRKVSKIDVVEDGNVTYKAIAGFFGNITCLHCRKEAWAAGIHN